MSDITPDNQNSTPPSVPPAAESVQNESADPAPSPPPDPAASYFPQPPLAKEGEEGFSVPSVPSLPPLAKGGEGGSTVAFDSVSPTLVETPNPDSAPTVETPVVSEPPLAKGGEGGFFVSSPAPESASALEVKAEDKTETSVPTESPSVSSSAPLIKGERGILLVSGGDVGGFPSSCIKEEEKEFVSPIASAVADSSSVPSLPPLVKGGEGGFSVPENRACPPFQEQLRSYLKENGAKNLAKHRARVAANLEKILVFARENGKITNNDVERLTGVKDRRATDYLNMLVKEKRLVRFGYSRVIFYKAVGRQ